MDMVYSDISVRYFGNAFLSVLLFAFWLLVRQRVAGYFVLKRKLILDALLVFF